MRPFVSAVGLGVASTCAVLLALVWIVFTPLRRSAIVYAHALVLRPEALAFESVPSGFEAESSPLLFVDERGLGILGAAVYLRWNGSRFVPGPGPSPSAQMSSVTAMNDVTLPGGMQVRPGRTSLSVVARDGVLAGVVGVPPGYQMRTVLAAGVHRVLLVPDAEETRTFFLDTRTRALTPGPAMRPWISTIAASDSTGTAVLVPGDCVKVTPWGGIALAFGFAALGLLGFARLGGLCAGGELPWFAAAIGIVLGVATVIGGYVWFVASIREGLGLH